MPVGVSRTAGMENGGPMTGTISASTLGPKRAQENFVRLMTHVASLYCMGGSSSISGYEAQELAMSVAYVLGIPATTAEDAVRMLDVEDPIELWRDGLTALDGRMDAALGVWREIIEAMPPIRNVALRDTLASLGELKRLYDTRFAAHEVPCDIDYQLSTPVDPQLLGLDYRQRQRRNRLGRSGRNAGGLHQAQQRHCRDPHVQARLQGRGAGSRARNRLG